MTTIDPTSAPSRVKRWLDAVRPEIDAALDQRLGDRLAATPARFREAIRYAVLGPGKRLRPAMTLAACAAVGAPYQQAIPAACAVEMLHAYTLVHDDLPALDNDDVRRGRPTVHVAYDEATAILVGDALQTGAFAALAELAAAPGPNADARAAAAVAVLARRCGSNELIGGQVDDLALDSEHPPDFATLESIHIRKTGALFSASCELGGICGDANSEQRATLARYGMAVGVAFQYADDRDDQTFVGHDEHRAQATQRMHSLCNEALECTAALGDQAEVLTALASWFGSRA